MNYRQVCWSTKSSKQLIGGSIILRSHCTQQKKSTLCLLIWKRGFKSSLIVLVRDTTGCRWVELSQRIIRRSSLYTRSHWQRRIRLRGMLNRFISRVMQCGEGGIVLRQNILAGVTARHHRIEIVVGSCRREWLLKGSNCCRSNRRCSCRVKCIGRTTRGWCGREDGRGTRWRRGWWEYRRGRIRERSW